MSFTPPNTSIDVTVPANQSIAIGSFGAGIAVISYLTDPSQQPRSFYENSRLENSAATYGPFAGERVVRIESGGCELEYVVGASPALSRRPYNPAAVAIIGGSINGTPVGANTPAEVNATTVKATGAVTAAGAVRGAVTDTALGTVGNGALSAAAMVGGIITRSGSTAAYTDTTDTAANIVAAIPNAQVGTSFDLTIINTVAFADTIAAGAGVTLSGTTAVAASSWRRFVGTITNVAAPAVTLKGVGSGSL